MSTTKNLVESVLCTILDMVDMVTDDDDGDIQSNR